MENKRSHLQMLQGIIDRLSQNSFLLKAWSVGLLSALFALFAANSKVMFIYLAYFPVFSFWILDAYFLRQERLFRKLYDRIRILEDSQIDFSMNTSSVKSEVDSWLRVMFSITLLIFYGTLILSVLLALFIGGKI
jgi:hypothetical protein